jgi:hypothetical protein
MKRMLILALCGLLMPVLSLGQAAALAAGTAVNVPGDTVILAKLAANLDLQQCTVGQQIEAQTTADVKQGKDVLIKKGSGLTGHVVSVQPATANQAESSVVLAFDGVQGKGSPSGTLHMVIRAIAPEEAAPASSTIVGGRGMPGEDTHAAMGGGDHAEQGGVYRLNKDSVGVSGIPGLDIQIRKANTGEQMSALTWSKADIKLKKATQISLLVVSQ